jgi:hypothetical protein
MAGIFVIIAVPFGVWDWAEFLNAEESRMPWAKAGSGYLPEGARVAN